MMEYIYGEFTDKQIREAVRAMHSDIHRLLLYKDKKIEEIIFESEEEYMAYFKNLLFRFAGMNELFGEPPQLVAFMSTLQAAYDEILSENFRYSVFRRAILDCHGYLESMFEDGTVRTCQV